MYNGRVVVKPLVQMLGSFVSAAELSPTWLACYPYHTVIPVYSSLVLEWNHWKIGNLDLCDCGRKGGLWASCIENNEFFCLAVTGCLKNLLSQILLQLALWKTLNWIISGLAILKLGHLMFSACLFNDRIKGPCLQEFVFSDVSQVSGIQLGLTKYLVREWTTSFISSRFLFWFDFSEVYSQDNHIP